MPRIAIDRGKAQLLNRIPALAWSLGKRNTRSRPRDGVIGILGSHRVCEGGGRGVRKMVAEGGVRNFENLVTFRYDDFDTRRHARLQAQLLVLDAKDDAVGHDVLNRLGVKPDLGDLAVKNSVRIRV